MSHRAVPSAITQPMLPEGERKIDRCTVGVEGAGRGGGAVEVVPVVLVFVFVVLEPPVLVVPVDAGVEVEPDEAFDDEGVELAGNGRVTITIFFDPPQPATTAAHATVTQMALSTAAA